MHARGDIVIVGGGPAGLTTAIALQRLVPSSTARMIVVEKGIYPREKYCAGAIGGRGDRILRELDACPDVPSVPIDGISLRTGTGAGGRRASEQVVRVGGIGRVIRRIEYDHALAKVAIARGVRVMEGTRVESVRADGKGAIVETSRGPLRAAVVIGCDGVGSVVRRAMGIAAGGLRAQVIELDTEEVASDRDRALLHFDASDHALDGYAWDFPTIVDGKPMVCRGVYRLLVQREGAPDAARERDAGELRELLAARLATMGLDLARYRQKRFAERGFEPAERVVQGPLMLAGEAAGVDPVTGEGIAQAIEYGAMAGRFLADALETHRPLDEWTDVVRRSRLAFDLSIRTYLVRMFYGRSRERIERFLVEQPSTLHLGCQHFAAMKLDPWKLAGVMIRGGAMIAGERMRTWSA